MGKSKRYKKASTWNNIKWKPENVDCIAKDDDIVLKIKHLWFLLQRNGGENNIVTFLEKDKHMEVREIMCSMFEFVYRLATEFGIDYIKIKGKPGKYNFVSRFFPHSVVLAKERENGEEVRYAKLDDPTVQRLDILRKLDGKAKIK